MGTRYFARKAMSREDKEILELMIGYLGGTVPGFTFKMPGADHHARWRSKTIEED